MQKEFTYSVDERPPFFTNLLLAVQHCFPIASTLVLPLLICAAAQVSTAQEMQFISACMFSLGIGTILMCFNTRLVGTRYLCPLLCEPAFLMVSLAAVQIGGLSLLFGMTIIAGAAQVLFSGVYTYIRRFFPPEISGIIVLMVGLSLVKPDLIYSSGSSSLTSLQFQSHDFLTAGATFCTMLFLLLWGGKFLSRYSLLIGVIVGFCVATQQGLIDATAYHKILNAPFFISADAIKLPALSFHPDLILPFVIASIAVTLKGVGGVITSQKINTPRWVRPEQTSIRRGIFTEGLATMLTGLCGGMGPGVANNNIALTIANRVTSRYVGFAVGALFILFACIPKIAMLFIIMPKAIVGAMLLFVTSYLIVAGIQIISSAIMDTRKIFIIGLSLIAGTSIQVHPETAAQLPEVFRLILGAPIITTTLTAIILNLLFQLGSTRTTTLQIAPSETIDNIRTSLEEQRKEWMAAPVLIADITDIISTLLSELQNKGVHEKVNFSFKYTDYQLICLVSYRGPALNIDFSDLAKKTDALNSSLRILRNSMPELAVKTWSSASDGTSNIMFNFIQ